MKQLTLCGFFVALLLLCYLPKSMAFLHFHHHHFCERLPNPFHVDLHKHHEHVVKLALKAYTCARREGLGDKRPVLTIIDFWLPSTYKRLWVINVHTHKILFHTYVTQGVNSGYSKLAKHFSNRKGSLESSIGLYLTGKAYDGYPDGYSLHIIGLEKGFNNNAAARNIVIHGASYASPLYIREHGMLGDSSGCLAVEKRIIKPLINTIKSGTLVFAYYPNQTWLHESRFLHCGHRSRKHHR